MSIHQIDVRIPRNVSPDDRRVKAARSAVKFLRRQAEARRPESKEELARIIWKMYWRMYKGRLLAAPRTTRRMLRRQFGHWGAIGVKSKPAVAA